MRAQDDAPNRRVSFFYSSLSSPCRSLTHDLSLLLLASSPNSRKHSNGSTTLATRFTDQRSSSTSSGRLCHRSSSSRYMKNRTLALYRQKRISTVILRATSEKHDIHMLRFGAYLKQIGGKFESNKYNISFEASNNWKIKASSLNGLLINLSEDCIQDIYMSHI